MSTNERGQWCSPRGWASADQMGVADKGSRGSSYCRNAARGGWGACSPLLCFRGRTANCSTVSVWVPGSGPRDELLLAVCRGPGWEWVVSEGRRPYPRQSPPRAAGASSHWGHWEIHRTHTSALPGLRRASWEGSFPASPCLPSRGQTKRGGQTNPQTKSFRCWPSDGAGVHTSHPPLFSTWETLHLLQDQLRV